MVSWIEENQNVLLKSYLRRASLLLTKHVKWLLRKNGSLSATSWRDKVISEILQGSELTQKTWDIKRKTWRDSLNKKLEEAMKKLAIEDIVSSSFEDSTSFLTPKFVTKNMFSSQFRRSRISCISVEDFTTFLQAEIRIHLEQEMMESLKKPLLNEVRTALGKIQESPRAWVKKPVYKKQTMSFASDDGQVYDLTFDENKLDVNVHLSFKSRERITCSLETPERFHAMIKKGFKPLRGFLTKKNGHKLVLTIPFGKKEEPQIIPNDSKVFMRAGLDLGLKTLGVLSIAPCTMGDDGTIQSVGKEIKNYFIDQKQLAGSRDEWLQGNPPKLPPFNFKRRLTNLQKISYGLQSKMDRYKQAHPKIYRNKIKFMKIRREWKRVWQKIQNLHEELARLVANRAITACQHHAVRVLNVEDLSWSQHGKKREVGFYLTRNQVHWFFGKIQDYLLSLGKQVGIKIKKIDARNTSKRCSRCNKIGIRTGKKFLCPHCTLTLDSDLNAARNISQSPFPCNYETQGRVPVATQQLS